MLQIERINMLDSKIGRRYQNVSTPDAINSGSLIENISKVIRIMNEMFANGFDTNFLIISIIIIQPNKIRLPK